MSAPDFCSRFLAKVSILATFPREFSAFPLMREMQLRQPDILKRVHLVDALPQICSEYQVFADE